MAEDLDKKQQGQEPEPFTKRPVSRREFLKYAGLAGAVVAVGGGLGGVLAACGSNTATTTSSAAAQTTTTAAGTTTSGASTSSSAGTTASTGAAAGAFAGTVTIGALASMTGANAMTGAEMKWAYEQAAKDINAKGGLNVGGKSMEMKLNFVDDQSDATQGSAAAEKLIKAEGLKLILSTNITPINLAAAIVAEKYQAYYQIATSWTDYIEQQHFKWASDIFFTPATAVAVPFNVMKLQPAAERPKNWCMLTTDDQDGQGLADGAVATAKQFGYNPPLVERYTPGTKDYSSIILKLKDKQIDALIFLISPADGITFVKQMKEQNFSPKMVFGWKGSWPTEFMQGLGADSNYIGHDGFWSENNGAPGSKELGDAFKKDHNGLDSVSIGLSYASVQILGQAIEKAGSTDPGAVRDAVFGGTFKGTTMGDVTYSSAGICNTPCYGLWWLNGKRIQYWPDQGNKWQWFVPWNQR